tara:strand:- start:485 stop:1267 length:783 start_codon:yes stop_codon:yes gene_type:complete
MDLIQLVLLSIIQGITEFLPISSSAHLILFSGLIGEGDQGIVFDVVVHFGTLLAVIYYFRYELLSMISSLKKGDDHESHNLLVSLFISSLPILILGFLLRGFVEDNLRSIGVIAYSTIFFGILLYLSSIKSKPKKDEKDLNLLDSLVIGFGQSFALIPGASRSGVTMMTALFLGYKANFSARYSFLLSIPTILAISVVEIFTISKMEYSISLDLLLALGISFIFAFFTISFFLKALDRIGLTPFIVYRLILGFVLILFWM